MWRTEASVSRSFLIDAVQAAAFITDKKSEELIGKIAALGGSYRAEVLTRNLVLCKDNYYILCYSARHKGTANYRVDRMEAVTIL